MKLKKYMLTITQEEFAKKLNVTQGIVSRYVNGTAIIPAKRAVQIEKITKGIVTRKDLRPDLFK